MRQVVDLYVRARGNPTCCTPSPLCSLLHNYAYFVREASIHTSGHANSTNSSYRKPRSGAHRTDTCKRAAAAAAIRARQPVCTHTLGTFQRVYVRKDTVSKSKKKKISWIDLNLANAARSGCFSAGSVGRYREIRRLSVLFTVQHSVTFPKTAD